MFQSRDVLLFIKRKFETDINECNKDIYEFFTGNVHFDFCDDTGDTVLTYENAAGTDREVLQPQQNRRQPDRFGMFAV